ncbi:LPXTG-motif cell wall anchor domain-containing protein [Clostridium collagenovorans DSM 3089]|uniref:LPXTG-motif cell wall anchor domain-containing protein n=1 Tax=Clostridium collagenovorans DSM 3089 TaxID=1121306 RepID=A0A1M5Y8A2_9CLOT|nr:MucBP domain-containing protein [Clostridium collagenovorans]SHI08320.1 LPXTG-motif cell wall anchor domain-containing protein [Clostridium collagenovorans DSM 3089]
MKRKTLALMLASVLIVGNSMTTFAEPLNSNYDSKELASFKGIPGIFSIENPNPTLENDGGIVKFKIKGENLDENLTKVKILLNNASQNEIINTLVLTGFGNSQNLELTFPKNTDTEDKIYSVLFNEDGGVNFSNKKTITVKGCKSNDSDTKPDSKPVESLQQITNLEVLLPTMSSNGKYNPVKITGENLKPENLSLQIFEISNGIEIYRPELSNDLKFKGTDTYQEATLEFPENNNDFDLNYIVKAGLNLNNGSPVEYKNSVPVKIKSTKLLPDIDLKPLDVTLDENHKIVTMKFEQDIFNAKASLEKLKNEISICKDYIDNPNELIKLNDEDTILINKNILTISLNEKIISKFGHILINPSALKTSDNKLIGKISSFIDSNHTSSLPKIYSNSIIDNKTTLSNKGGKVSVKIKGGNLSDSLSSTNKLDVTMGKILHISNPIKEESDINVKVTGSGEEQTLEFSLPENTSNKSQSYRLMISLNSGSTYLESNSKKLVFTVLPENKTSNDITLSHMTIYSYATTGNADNTYTITPLLQESKKTRLHLYGSNLDKTKTKVKIIDEYGVEWPVYNIPAYDSHDHFIMVNFDGTGIKGNGVEQDLEIICPNNMNRDITYTIQVAPDGVNFNTETVVTVTVLSSKSGEDRNPVKKTVTINYIDEDGNNLSDSKNIIGYSWFNLYSLNINSKNIEGYELKTSPDLSGTIGDEDKTLNYVYKKVSENLGTDKPTIDDPTTENSGTDKPKVENPTTENSGTDKSSAKNDTVAKTTIDVKHTDRIKSTSTLPQTGQDSMIPTIASGLMVTLSGLFVGLKSKKKK